MVDNAIVDFDASLINVPKPATPDQEAVTRWQMPTGQSWWAYSGKVPNERLWWKSPSAYRLILARRFDATTPYAPVMQIDLPVPPEAMVIQSPMAVGLSATMGGIISEHNGAVFKEIEMSGSFGVLPFSMRRVDKQLASLISAPLNQGGNAVSALANEVLNQSINTNNALFNQAQQVLRSPLFGQLPESGNTSMSYETGYGAWRWVSFFFENYAALRKQEKKAKYVLILRILKEERDYLVEPITYVVRRDKNSPYEYKYQMLFRSFGSKSIDITGDTKQVFQLLDMAKDLQNTIVSSGNVLALSSDLVSSFGRAVASSTDIIKDLGNLVGGIISIPTSILNLPDTIQKGVMANLQVASQAIFGATSAFGEAVNNFNNVVDGIKSAFSNAIGNGTPVSSQGASGLSTSQTSQFLSSKGEKASASVQKQMKIAMSGKSVQTLASGDASLQRMLQDNQRRLQNISIEEWKQRKEVVKKSSVLLSQATGNDVSLVASIYGLPPTKNPISPPSPSVSAIKQTFEGGLLMASGVIAQRNRPALAQVSFFRAIARVSAAQGNPINLKQSKVLAPVIKGQTLEKMALLYLGDGTRWNEIAVLNNLKAPYIDEEGVRLSLLANPASGVVYVSNNSVVKVGEIVFLSSRTVRETAFQVLRVDLVGDNQRVSLSPISSLSSLGVSASSSAPLDSFLAEDGAVLQAFIEGTTNSRESIFIPSDAVATLPENAGSANLSNLLVNDGNKDFALDQSGDVILDAGEIRNTEGVQNIQQQIRLIVSTPKGSLVRHPDFGISKLDGISSEDFSLDELVREISNQIGADPSLGTVTSMQAIMVNNNFVNVKGGTLLRKPNIILPLSFQLSVSGRVS